jgi:hypothetical protein
MAPIRDSTPAELQRLIDLGKQKKLWTIEVCYNVVGTSEAKMKRYRNLEVQELMTFRESMFKYGFKVGVEPGHWKIVCPIDIIEVDLYQQSAYFFDAPTDFTK